MSIAVPRQSRPYNVPLGGSRWYFSGREQELRDVRELLKGTETVGVVACVEGLAGIGKTVLALQLVERLAADGEYPGGLFWLNAELPDLTSTWGGVIADELGLPAMPIAERAAAAVAHVRQLQEPVLLVLDNVEQWKVGHQPHPLPTGPHIKTLITTRSRNLGGLRFQHYSLKFLPESAAQELLRRLAGTSIEQQPGFADLIEHLGGHALALELAGAYLADRPISPREYLGRLRRGEALPADITEQTRYQRTVDEALDLSWERLGEKAREVWTIAAQFEPAAATNALLQACGVDEEAMHELSRLHLIEANGTTWEMHRLVRAYGRKKGVGTEAGLRFLLGCAEHAAAIDIQLGFNIYLADRPHLDGAVSRAPEVLANHPAELSSLLNGIGTARQSLGSYQEARELLARALESDVNHFGEVHFNTATSRSNLAVVLRDLGDIKGAKELLQKALASNLNQFGEDHPSVATCRSILALALKDLGDLEGARDLLQKALASDLRRFGEDHLSVATRRANLAGVLKSLGELEGARDLLQMAIRSVLNQLGEHHPSVATCRSNLALVLKGLGDTEGARELLQRALASNLNQFGEDHPSVTAERSNLAGVLKDLGDLEGARELFQLALASDLKQFGDGHPRVATNRSNLALVLKALGDLKGARELLQKALASNLKQFGEDHPSVATRRSNLAGVLQDLGDLEGARELLQKALASDLRRFGEDHASVATRRSNLAVALQDLGDLEGARELLQKALVSDLRRFGEDHASVATRRSNLAGVLQDLGDLEGARELLQKALASNLKQFGEDHPSVATSRSNLAVALEGLGDKEGAQVQIRAALKCVAYLPPGSRVRSHVEHLAGQLLSESAPPKRAAPAKAPMSTHSAPNSSAASIRPSEAVFADLHADYESGQLIVFAGAGLSMAAGLPSWPALAQKLRDRLVKEGKAAEVISEIDNLIQSKQLIDALSAIKSALGATEFNIAIERAVDDTKLPVPDVAKAIAELQPKLRGVITTNLDRFLERAFKGEWNEVITAPGNLAQQRHFIWKLHGTRKVRNSWVFTRGQYDRATFGQPAQRALFEALVRSCPILFVGYGLVDDDFDQTLGSIRALSGDQPPHHYALMKGPLGQYQREKLQDSGLRLLEYGEHSEVPAILRALPSGQLPPAKVPLP